MATVSVIAPPRGLVIACIEDHPKAIMLLRMARSRAEERGTPWRAVFVETPFAMQADSGAHERMLRLLTAAEQMGGGSMHIEAETLEGGLASVFEKEAGNISLVIVGSVKSEGRASFLNPWRASPWMRIVKLASRYTQVEIVPLSEQYNTHGIREKLRLQELHPAYIAYSLVSVGIAWLGAILLQADLPPALFRINNQNIALLFMIGCAFSAGRFGLFPGLIASVTSFFIINYYFTVPYYILKLNTVTDLLNMGLFLSAALLISLFASQTREYARKAARREMKSQALFTLYRMASEAFSSEQALEKLHDKLEKMLDMDIAFFLPSPTSREYVIPAYPLDIPLDEADRKALDLCWKNLKTTGAAAPFNPGTNWRFEPMISPTGEVGVFGARIRNKKHIDTWLVRLIPAIADQIATVLEHINLEQSMEQTRISEEREKLRSMLLSSVSHDFKTPIAGIIGALSVYRSLGERLSQSKRDELIDASIEEARRLDSFITNILDMTRLESGNIRFKQEWHDAGDMVAEVTRRLEHRLKQHVVKIHPLPQSVSIYMDMMMTGQVLQNILDNACKYTPHGTLIDIRFDVGEESGFQCSVHDHGNGLPPERIEQVFDKYERLHKKDMQVAGTGLGLAISRAVMEAQGGWIRATNHPEGGAVFTFCLPQWRYNVNSQPERVTL